MTNDKQREDLVPIDVVLADMKQGDGIVSSAAKDYYGLHYATEEEKIAMDKQDKLTSIGAALIYGFLIVFLVLCVAREVFAG